LYPPLPFSLKNPDVVREPQDLHHAPAFRQDCGSGHHKQCFQLHWTVYSRANWRDRYVGTFRDADGIPVRRKNERGRSHL